MTDRERLIEILSIPIHPRIGADPAEVVADYLLDNDVRPVVHAHWKGHIGEDGELMPYRTCSKCRYPVSSKYWIDGTYCPNCGAKMSERGGLVVYERKKFQQRNFL